MAQDVLLGDDVLDINDHMVTEITATPDRREKTRGALLQAGLALLARRPIDAIAIDEIVRAAQVSKGSFFNHFEDKEAFGRAVAALVRAELEARVAETNRDVADPARRVARAVCLYIRYAISDPTRASVLARGGPALSKPGAALNQGVLADVSDGLLGGRFSVPTAEAGVLFVLGVAQMAMARVLDESSATVGAALGQQLCALMLRGLGVPEDEAQRIAAQAVHEIVGG